MDALVNELDLLRARVLRGTLAFEPFRIIFVSKARRLAVFLSASMLLNFYLALAAPVWMLALGPLFFGVTHVFASLRFAPKIAAGNTGHAPPSKLLCATVLLIGGIRCLQLGAFTALPAIPPIPNLPGLPDAWEWLAVLVALTGFSARLGRASLIPTLGLIALAVSAWHFPLLTAATLMIGHCFMPFAFWLKSARSSEEKMTALSLLGFFTLIHLSIFSGATDALTAAWRLPEPSFAIDALAIARQVMPVGFDVTVLERALASFAFGQAVHYSLWIKAIPESILTQEIPLTFKQSKRTAVRDLGVYAGIATGLALLALGGIALIPVGVLREFYVAFASAHGYVELAALPFLWRWEAHAG